MLGKPQSRADGVLSVTDNAIVFPLIVNYLCNFCVPGRDVPFPVKMLLLTVDPKTGKLLENSELADAQCAPDTLETLAKFSVLSRLKEPENSSIYSKMRVYDGESLKDTDPKAKSYQEYRDFAGVDDVRVVAIRAVLIAF